MKETSIKFNKVADYLVGYDQYVKTLNKQGLFDEAKHFELFAIELAKIWYRKEFCNCNNLRHNEPIVDLMAKDGSFYVQVSTVIDISSKIKKTLQDLEDLQADNPKRNIKFILLNNKDLKDLNISTTISTFNQDEDIINVTKILKKAEEDKGFLDDLFSLLDDKLNLLRMDLENFSKALDQSVHNINFKIEHQINNSYIIDRSDSIQKIKDIKSQIVLITGDAGVGKSALCKIMLHETPTLYIRAERFIEKDRIEQLWGFDLERILLNLGEKSLNIFIDSLEFVSDHTDKLSLISFLLKIISSYKNVKVYMTCRQTDSSAFVKLKNYCEISTFNLEGLTKNELEKVKKEFTIIEEMSKDTRYDYLLQNPWYINAIVGTIDDISSIKDENSLRNKIWNDVICKDKINPSNNDKRRDTITQIILDRSINNALYLPKDNYQSDIIDALIRDNILIENENLISIKPKYDIVEDICFERFIDKLYLESSSDFEKFFIEVEKLGKCSFRRYQIWVSNKLWFKEDQEKFIYEIVFNDYSPNLWKTQTLIGITKSKNLKEFLENYKQQLLENEEIFKNIVKTINLYSFTLDQVQMDYIRLRPTGSARDYVIDMIFETEWFKNRQNDFLIVKLIKDFCNSFSNNDNLPCVASKAVEILNYYIEEELKNIGDKYYDSSNFIELINVLYDLSEKSKEHINRIWDKIKEWYELNNESYKRRFAEDIIEDALKFGKYSLTKNMPDELCSLAEFYWRFEYYNPFKFNGPFGLSSSHNDDHYKLVHMWGLSKECSNSHYGRNQNLFWFKSFIYPLLQCHPAIAIKFINNFINKSVEIYSNNPDSDIEEFEIILNEDVKKSYLGNINFWFAYRGHANRIPQILQDMLMCLEAYLLDSFEKHKDLIFIKIVKEYILKNSNNIMIFPIFISMALKYMNDLKDFAIEFISNMNFVMFDLSRKTQEIFNHNIHLIGILSSFDKKMLNEFHNQDFRKFSLQDYSLLLQVNNISNEKIYKLLDYLYENFPNDQKFAREHLNINKMDYRKMSREIYDENNMVLIPKLEGESKKLADDRENEVQPINEMVNKVNDFFKNFNDYDLDYLLNIIQDIKNLEEHYLYNNGLNKALSKLILLAFTNKNLPKDKRILFIEMMLSQLPNMINANAIGLPGLSQIFSKVLIFEPLDYCILWKQLKEDISDKIKNKIKLSMYNVIGKGVQAQELLKSINIVIQSDEDIKTEIVTGFINSSIKKGKLIKDKDFKSIKKLIDLNNIRIETLYSILNLHLSIQDDCIEFIFKFILENYIANIDNYGSPLGYDCASAIKSFLEYNFFLDENYKLIVDILFNEKLLSKNHYKVYEFYEEIFGELIPIYYDSYIDRQKRKHIYSIWNQLEQKVNNIAENRERFYPLLIFTKKMVWWSPSECKTEYLLEDKTFIIDKIKKYGNYDLSLVIRNLKNLNINCLLPEILIGIDYLLKSSNNIKWIEITNEMIDIVFKAYSHNCDIIKNSALLRESFESILEIMVSKYIPEAAVILDEFRIH